MYDATQMKSCQRDAASLEKQRNATGMHCTAAYIDNEWTGSVDVRRCLFFI